MRITFIKENRDAEMCIRDRIYIQEETYICKNVDPWGGSYYVESLTNELAHKAWELIQEIEKLGGMATVSYTHLDVYKRQCLRCKAM